MDSADRRLPARLAIVGLIACGSGLWLGNHWFSRSAAGRESAFQLSAVPAASAAADFSLQEGSGRSMTLRQLRGQVVLLFFGFTRCPDVCPTELFKLAQVMKELGKDAAGVQVLFVTLDPERDTPALMSTYAAAFDSRFIGLTGSRAQIDAVAKAYFVAHAKVASGDSYVIDHSTATYIIDTQGRLRLLSRMETPVQSIVHDVRVLLNDAV